MKKLRLFAALFVAISTLFITDPAFADSFTDWTTGYNVNKTADCVQFSYTWGSASKSYPVGSDIAGVQFNVDVQNDTTNKIGGNGEVFDSYSIQMDLVEGGAIVDTVLYEEARTKHVRQPRQIGTGYTGHVDSINVTLRGIDNGFWGGYYGPIMCSPWLNVFSSVVASPTPVATPSQEPEVTAPASPEPTTTPVESPQPSVQPTLPTPTPEVTQAPATPEPVVPSGPTFPSNSVHGSADEGWDLTLTAPEGYKFDAVYFASYGVPDNYTVQWCNAEVSVQKAEEAFLGKNTATIASSNGVFGDPCGGTYKRLQVVLTYVADVPVVVPEPEVPQLPVQSPPESSSPPQPSVTPSLPTETQEPVTPTEPPVPTPTTTPTVEVVPTPTPTKQPVVPVVFPDPTPSPTPSQPESPVTPSAVVGSLLTIPPSELTTEQVTALVDAALETFQTADQGSPAYEQALQALAVAAQADDPEVPQELAAIPLLGNAAAAVLDTFNALGNIGADMAPQVRETAKKEVVAAVIVTQVATTAAGIATQAAASAAGAAGSSSIRKRN